MDGNTNKASSYSRGLQVFYAVFYNGHRARLNRILHNTFVICLFYWSLCYSNLQKMTPTKTQLTFILKEANVLTYRKVNIPECEREGSE